MQKRLTQETREKIIELKLDAVPVREIAKQLETTPTTVQATWNKWLEATAAERSERLELVRTELEHRYSRIAYEARRGAVASRDDGDRASEARYMAAEIAALKEVDRLYGASAPAKVDVRVGVVDMTAMSEDELLAIVEGTESS